MTIEVHQPELEAIIEQRMASGRFLSVEDVLLQALKSSPVTPSSSPDDSRTLEQIFAKVRGLADDLDFSRDPSSGRPVDLS